MTDAVPRRSCAPDQWRATLQELRDGGFDTFDFLTAVDETDREEEPGFDLVVHLYDHSGEHLREVLVTTRVADGQSVESITDLWRGAAWHERETREMFGIDFDGFEDAAGMAMRPLLLPEGFEGTPLRKSFVLAARASKPWPGAKDPSDRLVGGKEPAKPRRPRRKVLPPGVPPESWGPR